MSEASARIVRRQSRRALAFLDAFVPDGKENVSQHVPAAEAERMLELMRNIGEGWKVPPIPAEVFNVNEQDRNWVNSQCTLQPPETFRQRISLSGGISEIENIFFIRASGFEQGSPFPPLEQKARAAGWKTLRMACGHDVMTDQPEQLTAALIDVA